MRNLWWWDVDKSVPESHFETVNAAQAVSAKESKFLESTHLSRRIAEVADERKALDIEVIDVRGRCSYADFLVIASGTSDRHVTSIAELVDSTLHAEGVRSIGREGLREGQWALIDFGSVMVHVFHQFTRQDYDLESLWRGPSPRAGIASAGG